MKNIIDDLLDYLEVRHSKYFVNKLFSEHPHNDNMYGLRDMLRAYNIESEGIEMGEKEVNRMLFPSICHIGKNFVIAVGSDGKEISFWANGKIRKRNFSTFKNEWDGNALVVTSTEMAYEQNYRHNMGVEWITKLSWTCMFFCPIVLLAVFLLNNQVVGILHIPVLALNIAGCVLSYLLLQKKIKEDCSISDKFCSMISEKGCDAVLASQKANVFYIYSWSEIGFAYFLANLTLLSVAPRFQSGLVLFNYAAMVYGIWSVWYQAVKVRKWCTLCLSVQLVMWLLGIYHTILLYNSVISLSSVFQSLCVTSIFMLVSVVTTHLIVKSYRDDGVITSMTRKIKTFKVDNDILKAKYMKEEKYADATAVSSVFWGKEEAPHQVTVVINPHCSHCRKIFRQIKPLLQKDNLRIGIRMVFLSFSRDYDNGCLFFIAAYQKYGPKKALDIYSKWFDDITQEVNTLIMDYELDINHDKVEKEYAQHMQWTFTDHVNRTPFVLVDGHILPSVYDIDDLEEMDEI